MSTQVLDSHHSLRTRITKISSTSRAVIGKTKVMQISESDAQLFIELPDIGSINCNLGIMLGAAWIIGIGMRIERFFNKFTEFDRSKWLRLMRGPFDGCNCLFGPSAGCDYTDHGSGADSVSGRRGDKCLTR